MKEYHEKINIYVPHEAGKRLDNDAQLFEIFKADQRSINKNRFLTMLLCGYYDEYLQERKTLHDAVLQILDDSGLSAEKQESLSKALVDEVYSLDIPKRKGKDSACFSFKPTKESERIILDVKRHPSERGYPSQFFCKMLISYLKKPISVRERIVFANSVEKIDSACASGRAITFSSIWDKAQWHEVMPYALVPSHEEMYNYLVCEEVNSKTGLAEVRSYRLNRMTNIGFGTRSQPISAENQRYCEDTARIAPQYAINSDEEICVRLNAAGAKLYNRIYYGRPPFERLEPLADGSGYYYYFRCSPVQVFHYFRRFDNCTAEILSPTSLREKMVEFHQGSLSPVTNPTEQQEKVMDNSDIYEYHFEQLFNLVMRDRGRIRENDLADNPCDNKLIHLGTDEYYTLKRIADYADREARFVVLRMIKHLMNRYGIQYISSSTSKSLDNKYHCDFSLFENGQSIGIVILNHNHNFPGLPVLREKYREYKELSRIEVFYLQEDRTVQTSSTHKTFRDWLEYINAIENEEDNGYIHFALIKDFFAKYFGINEYRCFRWYVNRFNLKTQTAIGYRTIITPTEDAVQLFKDKCSQRLRNTDINGILPTWFPSEQAQKIKKTYFDRGLYKAMVGNAAFADSYISSEWYYEIFKVTGAIDRTGVVTGYLKSVEQLLFSIIELHKGIDKTIKERGGHEFIPYSHENEDDHDKTLNALIGFVKHYDDIWLITPDAKQPIIQALNKWREEYRNGYFHKDNLHDDIIVAGIRKTAYSLYAMILGSFVIGDDQLSKIGIDEPTVFIPESPEVLYDRFEKWAAPIIKFDIPDNTVALAFKISPIKKEDKWEIIIQALSRFEKKDYTWNQNMSTLPNSLYSSFQWKDNCSREDMITVVVQMVDRLRAEASPLSEALNAIRTIVVGSVEPIKIYSNW